MQLRQILQPQPTAESNDEDKDLSTDQADTLPTTDADKAAPTTMTTTTSTQRKVAYKNKDGSENTLLANIDQRGQAFLEIQKKMLESMQSQADPERDAFSDWIRTVLRGLDYGVWHRCQMEMGQMLYRYIAESDTHQKTSRKAPFQQETEQHPRSSTSHQVVHAFEQPQQRQQQLWQPHPRYWPAQPVASKVSVFNSMDACWVQQKFPQAYQDQQSNSSQQQQTQQEMQQNQSYTLIELQPVQRPQASGNVFGNITPVNTPSPMNLVSQMPRTPSEFNLSDFLHNEDSDKQQGLRSDIQQVPPSQQD